MSDLNIGDRVKVVFANEPIKTTRGKILNGATGTVKDTSGFRFTGIEFDDDIGGNTGSWNGKNGHCGYVDNEYLEKIEETDTEETKTEILEQKILKALREEIGVRIGEEFEAYESGEKHWICKFEENGFVEKLNGNFYKSYFWKDIISNFQCFNFKRKPFMPRDCQEYFYLEVKDSSPETLPVYVNETIWVGSTGDYGMLALGNVFRNGKEALENRDKLLEKLEKLREGEQI